MGNSVQNFFTSRDNNVDPDTYVGQLDRLWYNPDTNQIFISDGVTPGGQPVDLGANANAVINNLTVNSIGTDDSSAIDFRTDARFTQGATVDVGLDVFGTLAIDGNLTVTGNIPAATTTKIGGVRAGPGANISNTGLLTIDSANVPFSFGNFTADDNLLTIVNSDENMILATQGSAEIQLVGNIGFYKSNGLPPSANNRFFFAQDDGQLTILVPAEDPIAGGVEIIGSATGNFIDPGAVGTMLHLTGNPDIPCRVYHDTLGNYSSYVARRYNGTTASPGQVLAGQDVFRINTTAATDAGMGNVAMCQVSFTALENQTTTAQGSSITFTVTPIGSPAASRVDVATITVADGVTATKFTTAGTVTATGNITGGNLITGGLLSVSGNITGGNVAGTLITGTLATAAQPNVTSVGTLTSLTVTGNVSGGNLTTAGSVTGNGRALTSLDATNLDTGTVPTARLSGTYTITVSGSATTAGTVTTAAQPNITSVGTLISLTVTGNVSGGNLTTDAQVVATGNITGGNILTAGLISATGNITGGNVAGTTFTGNVIGNVTGTATTATNLAAATSILAGQLNINPTAIGKNTTSTQTFTLTGLTTSHKVIVMPQADFSYGLSILAAYPSALNTLSVQFQEQGGGVDPPAFNLAYFAWV